MKLAISNIAWQSAENEQVYCGMREAGIAGLEIAPTKYFSRPYIQSDDSIANLRREVERHKLRIVALQSLLFGQADLVLFESGEKRKALAEYLKKGIVFAHKLGARVMVFGSPKNRLMGTMDRRRGQEIALEFFHNLGDWAAGHEVVFCLETNPKQYGADFLCSTTETIGLVQQLNHPAIRVNLDIGAMTLNREDYQSWIEYCPLIGHLHVSEPFLASVPQPGTSHACIARLIKSSGYDRWVSLEMKARAEQDNTANVKSALVFLKEHYG